MLITPLDSVEYCVYPESPFQNGDLSITDSSGRYDMTRISHHEKDIVLEVLKISRSPKYPHDLQAVGLANESSVIRYKPRYILYEIIIQQYSGSSNPLDVLAVGEAYRSKGAMFYEEALAYLERFITSSSLLQRKRAQQCLFDAREPFLSYHIADLLDKTGRYEKALTYAFKAKEKDKTAAPAYVQKIGDIYRKTEPQAAIDFYREIVKNPAYSRYSALFEKEVAKAIAQQARAKPYKRRPYKPSEDTIAFEQAVSFLAKQFLPNGQFFND